MRLNRRLVLVRGQIGRPLLRKYASPGPGGGPTLALPGRILGGPGWTPVFCRVQNARSKLNKNQKHLCISQLCHTLVTYMLMRWENPMSKGQDSKKELKKVPAKTQKEKKADKKVKKAEKSR